ncbi:MAG TPA: hybrid sensor histidine kinase/response regulator, partial [Pseudomonas sp.]|nr:hybrid sensor histidine kinase/response regulator [Pseudomonas sp.]
MRSLQTSLIDDTSTPLSFLLNGGEIGRLLQTMNWQDSPLGTPHGWSPHLQAAMATLLPAQTQVVLFWGPDYVALYNDAYAPTIGNKHPQALGRPARENWAELWDDLEPLLRGVR